MEEEQEVSPRAKRLIVGAAVASTIAGVSGAAFSPFLAVNHPLLLVGLSADMHHIVLVAGSVSFLPLFVVGLLRRLMRLLITYGLGVVYGRMAVEWTKKRSSRWASVVDNMERLFQRAGSPILLVLPIMSMAGLAGAARVRLWAFLIPIVIGQVVWMGAFVLFGRAVKAWTDIALAFLSQHVMEATAIVLVAVVVQQLIARRRGSRPAEE